MIFFLNVPVGLLAVVAGVCLLPRTRGPGRPPADKHDGPTACPPLGADPGGTILLGVATVAGMLAVSALSGLGAPGK